MLITYEQGGTWSFVFLAGNEQRCRINFISCRLIAAVHRSAEKINRLKVDKKAAKTEEEGKKE